MQTRVMLVEDRADFRNLMVVLLSRQPDLEVVAQAASLEEARRHAASESIDVAVLDLGLPDGNGADLIGDLRAANPGMAVLILSASLDSKNLERVTEAGADEILDKLASPTEVVDVIRRLGSECAEVTPRVRIRLTPLLTPLSAIHAETSGNHQQENRLRYAVSATSSNT